MFSELIVLSMKMLMSNPAPFCLAHGNETQEPWSSSSPSLCDSDRGDPASLSFRVWTACLWMRSLTPPCMCMSPQSTAPTSSWASMTSGKRIFSVTWLWLWRGRSSGPTGLCWLHAVNTSGRRWSDRRKMTWWSACRRRYSSLVWLCVLLMETY